MSKQDAYNLLQDYYEERRAYIELLDFYKYKIEDTSNNTWKYLYSNLEDKIKELDIDIMNLQENYKNL
jgi:hypothetical protein